MLRFLVVVGLLGAAAFWLINRFGGNPLAPRVERRSVVIETQDLEVRFDRLGRSSASYMVFGGLAAEPTNSISNAYLALLDIEIASLIHQSYPDFHQCKSPGAAQAQRRTEDISFVAADGAARRALQKALKLHDERIRSGGDRTCVSVEGEHLELSSVKLKHDGSDITGELRRAHGKTRFFYAKSVKLPDCQSLLR